MYVNQTVRQLNGIDSFPEHEARSEEQSSHFNRRGQQENQRSDLSRVHQEEEAVQDQQQQQYSCSDSQYQDQQKGQNHSMGSQDIKLYRKQTNVSKVVCLITFLIAALIVAGCVYYFVASQKKIEVPTQVAKYDIKANYSYNTHIDINTTIIKDGTTVYSRNLYFTRFACTKTTDDMITMLVAVHNVTAFLNNMTERSVYQSFPDLQKNQQAPKRRSLDEVELVIDKNSDRMLQDIPPELRDQFNSMLCFSFTYNSTDGFVSNIYYPIKLESKFRNTIPNIISSFMPQVGTSLMKKEGVKMYRPGLGLVTELYAFTQAGEFTIINKTFVSDEADSSKNYNYFQTAVLRAGTIFNNTVTSITQLSSKSQKQDTVKSDYSVFIYQNLTLTFLDKYELPSRNVTSFLEVYDMIQKSKFSSVNAFQEFVQQQLSKNTNAKRRSLRTQIAHQQGAIPVVNKYFQNKLFSLPVFGSKLEGFLDFFVFLDLINTSNVYKAQMRIGAISYIQCGSFQLILAECVFDQQGKPVSMQYTLDKIVQVISSNKPDYDNALSSIQALAESFGALNDGDAAAAISSVTSNIDEFNSIVKRVSNQQNVPKTAADLIKKIQNFKKIFQDTILTFIDEKITYLDDLISKAKQLMKNVEDIAKQQFQKVKKFAKDLSLEIDSTSLTQLQFLKQKNTIKLTIQYIVNDDFLEQEWQKQVQALKPVGNFITEQSNTFTTIKQTLEKYVALYKNSIQETFNQFGIKMDMYLVNNLKTLQQTLQSRPAKAKQLIASIQELTNVNIKQLSDVQLIMSSMHTDLKDYILQQAPANLFGPLQKVDALINSASTTSSNQKNVKRQKQFYDQYAADNFFMKYKKHIEQITSQLNNQFAVLIFNPVNAEQFFQGVLAVQSKFDDIVQSTQQMLSRSETLLPLLKQLLDQYPEYYTIDVGKCCGKNCDPCSQSQSFKKYSRDIFIDIVKAQEEVVQALKVFYAKVHQLNQDYKGKVQTYKMKSYTQKGYNDLVKAWNNLVKPLQNFLMSIQEYYAGLNTQVQVLRTAIKQQITHTDLLELADRAEALKTTLQELNTREQTVRGLQQKYHDIETSLSDEAFVSKYARPLIQKLEQILKFVDQILGNTIMGSAPQIQTTGINLATGFRNGFTFMNNYNPKIQQIKALQKQIIEIVTKAKTISDKSGSYMELFQYQKAFEYFKSKYSIGQTVKQFLAKLQQYDYILPAITNPSLTEQQVNAILDHFKTSQVYGQDYDKLQTYFEKSLEKIEDMYTIIKSLDFQLRTIYVSARQQMNVYIPRLQKYSQKFKQIIQQTNAIYQKFSNIDIGTFTATMLDQIVNDIKTKPEQFQKQYQTLLANLRYGYFASALSRVEKQQFLDYRFSLQNSLTHSHNSIQKQKENTKRLFLALVNQFIPFLNKYSFGNILALKQIFGSLQGFKAEYLENIKKQLAVITKVLNDLGLLLFSSAFKMPQMGVKLIQKAKQIFADSLNTKINAVIQKINGLKDKLPAQFDAPLDQLIQKGQEVKQKLKLDVSSYFIQVQNSIEDIKSFLGTIDLNLFDSLQTSIDRASEIKNKANDQISEIGQNGKKIGDAYNVLFQLNSYDLKAQMDIIYDSLQQIKRLTDQILTVDQQEILSIVDLFYRNSSLTNQVKQPMDRVRSSMKKIIQYKIKAIELTKAMNKLTNQKIIQRYINLKKGEEYAKEIAENIDEEADQDDIVLFQRQTGNLLENVGYEYSYSIVTPFGPVIIKFGIQAYAALGGMVRIRQFRDVSGQLYVTGYVEISIGLGYGIPNILEFTISLVGRVFQTTLTVGLIFENVFPFGYVPVLVSDPDFADMMTIRIILRVWVDFKPITLYIQIELSMIWIEISIHWITIRIGIISISLPIINIRITMKDFELDPILLYEGPTFTVVLFEKKLAQFSIWDKLPDY